MPRSSSLSAVSIVILFGIVALALNIPLPPAHAETPAGLSTQWDSVIEYTATSGFTPTDVNITWTNTDSCGTFSWGGPAATWEYGPGVGAAACTVSLPTGSINETIIYYGAVLASCTDTRGAATYGSDTPSTGSAPGCTTARTGVTIVAFWAQAYDAAGNPISAGSSANYDWIIAVVVIILIIILLFFMRRKRRTSPAAATAQAPLTAPAPAQ